MKKKKKLILGIGIGIISVCIVTIVSILIFFPVYLNSSKMKKDYDTPSEITYEFEYDELLGAFWKSADAESCLSEFKSDNSDIIENGEFEIECTVSRYEINEMQWRYGFN